MFLGNILKGQARNGSLPKEHRRTRSRQSLSSRRLSSMNSLLSSLVRASGSVGSASTVEGRASTSMSEAALRNHLSAISFEDSGTKYIVGAISSPPAKSTTESQRLKNITGSVAITKPASFESHSHFRLQFSSLSGEFAFAILANSCPDILLVIDQPTSVPLTIENRKNKPQRINYTPDFLVVLEDSVVAVEVKRTDDLLRLCGDRPADWVQESGSFRFLPAERYFAALGIEFEVVPSDSLSWTRVQNIMFVERLRESSPEPDSGTLAQIRNTVRDMVRCSIADIVEAIGLDNGASVVLSIGKLGICADLDNALLSDPHSKYIASTPEGALALGALLGYVQKATSQCDAIVKLDELCDPRHLLLLGKKLAAINGDMAPWADAKMPSLRSLQRWRRAYDREGVEGLRPKLFKCGQAGPRVAPRYRELAELQIKIAKGSRERRTRAQSYIDYQREFEKMSAEEGGDERPYSYQHYCRLWSARRHSMDDARSQGGDRLANAMAPHGNVDDQLPMATRPFQVAHIDHCLAPTFTEWSELDLGQPWLTILVDAYETEPIASILRFGAPSYEADALVIRDCIRRHGRLPEGIVSDGGSDFKSTMFRATLAELNVHWYKRPSANPRSGAPVERTFGTFAMSVCVGRAGYNPNLSNLRSISSSTRPSSGPRRQLDELLARTEHILHEVLPSLRGVDGSPSALDARKGFEDMYGRQGVRASLDLRTLIATSVPIKLKGKTEPSGAIRVGDTRFYSTYLHGKSLTISKLSPRMDPEDPTVMYFAIDGVSRVAKSREAMENRSASYESLSANRSLHKPMTTSEKMERRKNLQRETPTDRNANATPQASPDATLQANLEAQAPHPKEVVSTSKIDWEKIESPTAVTTSNREG